MTICPPENAGKQAEVSKMIEEISPQNFMARRDKGELWQLLDVREGWEIDIASISGSVEIPMLEIPSRLAELDDSRPIAVLCHCGAFAALDCLASDSRAFAITASLGSWASRVRTIRSLAR